MAAFRIRYKDWIHQPEMNYEEGPFFHVFSKEEERLIRAVHILLKWADVQSLKHEMHLQGPEKDAQFKRVVIRHAVRRIEQGLKEDIFPNPPNGITDNLFITQDEHPILRELSQEKTCAYQIKEVTGLLCSASCPEDATARSHREFQLVAPTTQALCRACGLPDTDYLCSHFAHPEVLGHRNRGAIVVRQLANGLCNIGRSEVQKRPEHCRADGHECWVRFIDLMQKPLPIPASPSLDSAIHVQEDGVKEPMPRVFISYVRENSKDVTQLVDVLKAHKVDVWLDKTHLKPGDRWANVIRREIAQGDFFIACFSIEYSKRRKSYMNEEIIQAIEQLRQRPVDQPWFIPVLLSDCDIPDFNIGGGETLRSIQWVALYDDWNEGIHRILKVIQPEFEGEPAEDQRRNAYDEEDIAALIPWSMTSLLNDRKHERTSEKFSLVQDDHRICEYSRQEVDKLTPTQRERLFTADPEMAAWWRGKSITNGAWPLFRLKGGTWVSKDQINQVPREQCSALWRLRNLLEWYLEGVKF